VAQQALHAPCATHLPSTEPPDAKSEQLCERVLPLPLPMLPLLPLPPLPPPSVLMLTNVASSSQVCPAPEALLLLPEPLPQVAPRRDPLRLPTLSPYPPPAAL